MLLSKRGSPATKSQVIRDDLKNIKQWKYGNKNTKMKFLRYKKRDYRHFYQALIICNKNYNDLNVEHQKLLQINAKKKEISALKFLAANLENQGFKEIEKIDGL